MNTHRSRWTKLFLIAAVALPTATLIASPRPHERSLLSLVPGQVRETLQALRAFHEALLEAAGEDADAAKADLDVVRTQAIRFVVTIDSILTSEQKTDVLTALGDLRRMDPEDRRATIEGILSGVDEAALRSALEAVKDATPETRPAAVEAAVEVVIDGVSPALDERFGITRAQRRAIDAARESFWDQTREARVDLAVMRSENREAAFESLSEEDQQTLATAKARLEQKLLDVLSRTSR